MWKIDQGTETGTSSADFNNVLDWKTCELGKKSILLKNADGTCSLKYRLQGYVAEDGQANEIVPETELNNGEFAEFHYDRQWHRLVLQIKNGSGAADYQVDYEGQGV